ncbi:MAG: hypothetical protein K2P37_04355 [Oscillospiraceae bacterium]|nr:hypothetical protein [Oscillospiraceae bacterium]
MKVSIRRAAVLALCLAMTAGLLGGCARLLERSYGITEPYADRYWDSSAEDTLRAETYQDLVNSLLLLVEQKAEEGVIRCYGEAEEYEQVLAARREVRQETMLGSYLLKELQLDHEKGSGYSTVTCQMTYREDAEDLGALMPISDSQSLVDLLRLAVREDYEKLAAHFTYEPSREDVAAAVESLWQEICRSEMEELAALSVDEEVPEEGAPEGEEDVVPEESGEGGAEAPPEEQEDMPPEEEAVDSEAAEGEDGEAAEPPPEEPVIEYPPCPWSIRFYPNQETAEIVEVLLKP